jgi:hypothetical protein
MNVLARGAIAMPLVSAAALGCGRFDTHPPTNGTYDDSPPSYVGAEGTAVTDDFAAASCDSAAAGTALAGEACSAAGACAPTCCACAAGERLAASCVSGVCASGDVACSRNCDAEPPSTESCGFTYPTASCDACMTSQCCASEVACAGDASCVTLVDCHGGCGGAGDCIAECDATYGSSLAADDLEGCLASSCAAECP